MSLPRPIRPDAIILFSGVRGFDEDYSASIMKWFPILKEKNCEEKIVRLRGEIGWLRFHSREYNETAPEHKGQFEVIIAKDLKIIKEIWDDINESIGTKYLSDQYDYWVEELFPICKS